MADQIELIQAQIERLTSGLSLQHINKNHLKKILKKEEWLLLSECLFIFDLVRSFLIKRCEIFEHY
jgi:hypothetical protein